MSCFTNVGLINKAPKFQDFLWLAEYADGNYVSEFDLNNSLENSFYNIEKDKLIRFGLIGHNISLYFETSGIFKLQGRMFEFVYVENGSEYYLSGQPFALYNDIITYKDAEGFYDVLGGKQIRPRVKCFNFGYKTNLKIKNINFNFKPIVHVPMNKPAYFSVNITTNEDLNGILIIRKNSQNWKQIEAPLKKNISGNVNFNIEL